MSKTRRNYGQCSLPLPPPEPCQRLRAGSLRAKESVREALSLALDACELEREEVAEELSRLVGEDVSVHTLHSYTAHSKGNRRLPLEYAAALAVVLGDASIITAALAGSGYTVIDQEGLDVLEYGRLQLARKELAQRERDIRERLNGKR